MKTHKDLVKKMLKNPAVKNAYDELAAEHDNRRSQHRNLGYDCPMVRSTMISDADILEHVVSPVKRGVPGEALRHAVGERSFFVASRGECLDRLRG